MNTKEYWDDCSALPMWVLGVLWFEGMIWMVQQMIVAHAVLHGENDK